MLQIVTRHADEPGLLLLVLRHGDALAYGGKREGRRRHAATRPASARSSASS